MTEGYKMIHRNKELENTFKKGTNIELDDVYGSLLKKGISIEKIADMAIKLHRNTKEDIDLQDVDNDYKILIHLVVMYFLFNGAIDAFNDWVRIGAEDNHITTEKYIKDTYNI